jgi:hypothetical protein
MKTNKTKELLLEQLKKTPIIHLACERTGVGRASFYRWKNEDPIFAKQADEALAEGVMLMNDLAESKLLSSVKEGNLTGILFWLRNRHDAYKTRVEISSGQKDEVVITDEQEEIIKKAIGLSQIENRKEEKE